MSSILQAFPYPFFQAEAQQLHETLTQLHPSGQAALLIAQQSGIDTSTIFGQQAPFFVWKEILEQAAATGQTAALVQVVRDRLHPNSPVRPFIEDLLAGRPTRVSGEPRDAEGAPRFVADSDLVSEPEALLYQDDLTIQVGRVPALITTLQRLVTLAPAVCKLTVDIGGDGQYGTAFRIGPDRLLTNWHVLHRRTDGTRATVVTAEFGFEDDGHGGILTAMAMPCDVATIVADKSDDWAIIGPGDGLADAWPIVKLSEAAAPTTASSAFVIQHPRGERKRVGIVRNQVSFFDKRVVHYLTDTQVGSSGAPVFDAEGRLIALHHAGGRPQEVLGKPPIRKNEGILISRIVDGLNAHNIPVL
jgi:hypothetical protein